MKDVKYRPTIGIETHVQLKTKTKLFAAVGNDARNAPPNTLISHICVGLPGALPVLNQEAVNISARAALALGTTPQNFSKFERKHYFYPDLPKGYQITQYEDPIIIGGQVEIQSGGVPKKVAIERANLEEDAGKNTHPTGVDYSLVDLNRAGTPLLEIVSKPDIHSPAEAKAYVRELYLLMKYADVTDGDLYHGHMRFDLNVSVSVDRDKLGTRSEIKNLNSFRSVEAAATYEIDRQIEILEKGGEIVQETRGWDEAKQKTFTQRTKEEAEDYRYMPEPDVPPVELGDNYLERIKAEMQIMPTEWRKRLESLHIDKQQIEVLLEAHVERENINYLGILEKFQSNSNQQKFQKISQTFAHWFTNIDIPLRNENIDKKLRSTDLEDMYHAIFQKLDSGQIFSSQAKQLITYMLLNPDQSDVDSVIREHGIKQIKDSSQLEKIAAEVIAENPKAAEEIKAGQTKAIGFLVGQVMAKTKGQANPAIAQEVIRNLLNIK